MTPEGQVALWHRDCWELRDVPLPAATATAADAPLPTQRRLNATRFAVGLAAAIFVGTGLAASRWTAAVDDVPPVAVASRESLKVRSAMPAREDPPPRSDRFVRPIEDPDDIPLHDGKPLDELYPTLKSWIHPVTASAEYMPVLSSRLFGSERAGVERVECGAGHCGVDLDGPRGRPLVAVAAGIVIHIEHSEKGRDGRSGRYVRLQHEDGTFTAYMHMDEIADGLQPGGAVARGQYLGTLGATATYSSPPHLHFSLEIPSPIDARGTRYVNPAPFLQRSTIVPVIERPSRPALN